MECQKIIRDCYVFAVPHTVIGPENSCHSLSQSDIKQIPIVPWLPAFSRAFCSLPVFFNEFSLADDNVFLKT